MLFQFLEYLVTFSIMESTIKEPWGLQIQKVFTLLGVFGKREKNGPLLFKRFNYFFVIFCLFICMENLFTFNAWN